MSTDPYPFFQGDFNWPRLEALDPVSRLASKSTQLNWPSVVGQAHFGKDKMANVGVIKANVPPWTIGSLMKIKKLGINHGWNNIKWFQWVVICSNTLVGPIFQAKSAGAIKAESNRATKHRHLDLVLVLYAYRAFCIIGEHLNSSFPIPAIVIEICLCFTMAYLTPIVVCSKVTKPETK